MHPASQEQSVVLLRKYRGPLFDLVFFFENYLDSSVRENGEFYFAQMGKKNIILAFVEQYNLNERQAFYATQNKKKKNKL